LFPFPAFYPCFLAAQVAKAYSEETKLTWEMAHAFIQAIYAYPDGRREIRWEFKDIAK